MKRGPDTSGERHPADRILGLVEVLNQMVQREADHLGLSFARIRVLWHVSRTGPVTQMSLARRLGVSPRNVSGLLAGLSDRKLVTRTPHPDDARALVVSSTEQGEDLLRILRARLHSAAALSHQLPADLSCDCPVEPNRRSQLA
ncbi:MarR family winged helix-turn-helix transcriptional regulator [Nocardia thailandica]